VFNGNGYSDEWQAEAAARGLLNLRTTPDALQQFSEPAIIEVLEKYHVLSPRELASRQEVYLEQYIFSVHVEAKQTAELGRTTILPAAQRYLAELAAQAASLKAVDLPWDAATLTALSGLVTDLLSGLADLEAALGHEAEGTSMEHAAYARDALIPPMWKVRAAADALEGLVADDLWPLPTYQEMLTII
jgi:glutamine synthetase